MITGHTRSLALWLLLLVPGLVVAQESVLPLSPYDGTAASFLNSQLAADTLPGGIIPAGRVYELQRGAPYLSNGIFRIYAGQTLRMRARDSAGVTRPVIFLYPTGTGANPQNPPGNLFDVRGNVELKDLVISGYFEPIDTNINNLQGGLINIPTAGAGASIRLDGCILTNSNGNHIRTDGAPTVVEVKNCIFANMGFLGRSNLGAGKAFDFRDVSLDTALIQNNTFVNWQDRVIRHYNFANPLAGTGPIRYMKFDHNTLVNGMSYHGMLSLGNMGATAIITNNLLIDPFSLGNDTDATRQAEFVNNLETDAYGYPRMTWVFTTPNDSTDWTISNNFYSISDSGQAFLDEFAAAGVTGVGSPLTYSINGQLGADSVNAFTELSVALNNIPRVMTTLNRWYRSPSGGNKTKNTPNALVWNRAFDFDRRGWLYIHDTLDCAYPTSSPAYVAATAGYPVGDLNWFPARYDEWKNDPAVSVGPVAGLVPLEYALDQNYPNPFNPSTRIAFAVPQASRVRIEIYDLVGRKIATLIDGDLEAGTHSVEFDAARFSSGVYFYTFVTPDRVMTRKMMLLK